MNNRKSTLVLIISWGNLLAAGLVALMRWLHPATYSSNALLIVITIGLVTAGISLLQS